MNSIFTPSYVVRSWGTHRVQKDKLFHCALCTTQLFVSVWLDTAVFAYPHLGSNWYWRYATMIVFVFCSAGWGYEMLKKMWKCLTPGGLTTTHVLCTCSGHVSQRQQLKTRKEKTKNGPNLFLNCFRILEFTNSCNMLFF